MTSTYAKGTRIWLPDGTTGWVAGTIISLNVPSDALPSSSVTLVASYDQIPSTGEESKTLKFPLSVLSAAEGVVAGNIVPASPPPGQDALPLLRNPPLLESAEDLASLSNLNEPSGELMFYRWVGLTGAVLHAIATRYAMHLPYTYSGIVLVCQPECRGFHADDRSYRSL